MPILHFLSVTRKKTEAKEIYALFGGVGVDSHCT